MVLISRLVLLSICVCASHAFTQSYRPTFLKTHRVSYSDVKSNVLHAKRKRRKRKGSAGPPQPSTSPQPEPELEPVDEDELPDFDLEVTEVEESPQKVSSQVTPPGETESPITPAQMGSVKPLSSVTDLLSDRSLEKELLFEDPVDAEPLPTLSDFLAGGGVQEQPMGKKKARQKARRDAAIAAEEAEQGGFFSNLPFIGGGESEDSEFSPLKFLETGAWFGIGLLVLWEVYLNSPFFERAAPMAPIVYSSQTPP